MEELEFILLLIKKFQVLYYIDFSIEDYAV